MTAPVAAVAPIKICCRCPHEAMCLRDGECIAAAWQARHPSLPDVIPHPRPRHPTEQKVTKALPVLALAAGIVCAGHQPANANEHFSFMSGAQLVERCSSATLEVQAACTGYIMGLSDSLEEGETTIGGYTGCTPAKLTAFQTREAVIGWYWRHPDMWKLNAARVIARALGEMFPCATTARPKFNG